jgi:hypothetical protein
MRKFIGLAILLLIPVLLFGVAGESEFVVLKSDADTTADVATDTILTDTLALPLAHYKEAYLYTVITGLGTIEAADHFKLEKMSYMDSAGSSFLVDSTLDDNTNTLSAGCHIDTLLFVGRAEYFIVRWIAVEANTADADDSLAVGPIGVGYVGREDGK